jgi:hypothetical protein
MSDDVDCLEYHLRGVVPEIGVVVGGLKSSHIKAEAEVNSPRRLYLGL